MCLLQADPQGDLSTELERELGKLVKEKYKTDFYMLYNYPLAVSATAALWAQPLHSHNLKDHNGLHVLLGTLSACFKVVCLCDITSNGCSTQPAAAVGALVSVAP